jgi:hypothetical protein
MLLVWGFVLSFFGLLGAGCYEAFKVLAVIPSAFAERPAAWRNPMMISDSDDRPQQFGRTQLTARERAQNAQRAAQQER